MPERVVKAYGTPVDMSPLLAFCQCECWTCAGRASSSTLSDFVARGNLELANRKVGPVPVLWF